MDNLVKTVKITDEALPIIAAMEWEWENDNLVIGRLTCGQLDRPLYLAVNKGLDALGGKWDRKLGGHVFTIDPRQRIELLLDTGQVKVVKDSYFPTPRVIGLEMADMAWLMPEIRVLEPSAGTGELAEAILETEPAVDLLVAEKDQRRQQALKEKGFRLLAEGDYDFLTADVGKWPRIIQNPPFENGQDIDHVRYAYEHLEEDGLLVSVMSESPFFDSRSKARHFRQWLAMLDHQIIELERGAFSGSGTGVKAKLVIIHGPSEYLQSRFF